MDSAEPTAPNAEQIRYWNETAGPRWVAFQRAVDEQLRPLGEIAAERGGIARGDRVLDVGCGCGDTTIALARRVAPGGRVLGIDVSAAMLARARERAAGAANVEFLEADAQSHALPAAAFDVVYSRFGVMFFTDPAAAFRNLAAALRPGGRLAFVCWQALAANAWISVPLRAAAEHIVLPPRPAPDAPGPFSFADPTRVRDILAGARFRDVELEAVARPLHVGGAGASLDEAVHFLTEGVGPTSSALREAGPAFRARVQGAVREALAPFAGPDGVRMDSAAWVVTARA
jgi:SAM-dependent methyltransferase